jgi:hypothetical protein
MVVAIASMLAINLVSRRLTAEGNKLNQLLVIEPEAVADAAAGEEETADA